MAHLSSTESLSERQFAYRTGKSTTDAAREVVCRVMEAKERKMKVAVLFCDLSKAFDVADHDILAMKLAHYGIAGPALQLLLRSMTARSQVVTGRGGKVKSGPLSTTIGVAQGSSISNILFSLLMNDLPDCIKDAHVVMYADDVAAVVEASDLTMLQARLNSVASVLQNWFSQNGLILNVTKTNFVLFNLAGHQDMLLDVKLGGEALKQVVKTQFLGFTLDRSLTWEAHIDGVCSRIGPSCYALWRLSATLDTNMVRSIYFATVHSVLQYGVEFWGRAADWERVFRLQKKAIRAIVRIPQDESARPYFESLAILTVPALVIFQSAVYVHEHKHEYKRYGDNNIYQTRHAHRLRALPRRLAKTSRLLHVMGTAIYNRIPRVIIDSSSTQSFKRSLKKWLISQSIYNVNEFMTLKCT